MINYVNLSLLTCVIMFPCSHSCSSQGGHMQLDGEAYHQASTGTGAKEGFEWAIELGSGCKIRS